MTPERIQQLAHEWRAEAANFQSVGADGQAKAFARCADDLERMLSADDEVLTLAEAARECRYSADHLGRLVKRGDLKNYGRPHAPRVRRSELPKKSGKAPEPAPSVLPAALVKSVFRARRKTA